MNVGVLLAGHRVAKLPAHQGEHTGLRLPHQLVGDDDLRAHIGGRKVYRGHANVFLVDQVFAVHQVVDRHLSDLGHRDLLGPTLESEHLRECHRGRVVLFGVTRLVDDDALC